MKLSQITRKISTILLASGALAISNQAISRDYQMVGETDVAYVLVDIEQLRKMLSVAPLAFIKTIEHYKTPRDYSLSAPVQSEGYFMVADCEDRTVAKFMDRRFYDSKLSILKEVDYIKSTAIKDLPLNKITNGGAESIAIDYACKWIEANKNNQ